MFKQKLIIIIREIDIHELKIKLMVKTVIFRAWFYFRNGWSTYLAFIFAAINTLTVTYYLAIEKIPFLTQIFPSFTHYTFILSIIGIPALVLIGYIHFKKSPAYKTEASIGFESNPFVRRNLINSELNLQLNLKIIEMMIKLSDGKKLTENEINNFNQTKDELQKFVNERSIKNKMDLILLKKLMKET